MPWISLDKVALGNSLEGLVALEQQVVGLLPPVVALAGPLPLEGLLGAAVEGDGVGEGFVVGESGQPPHTALVPSGAGVEAHLP